MAAVISAWRDCRRPDHLSSVLQLLSIRVSSTCNASEQWLRLSEHGHRQTSAYCLLARLPAVTCTRAIRCCTTHISASQIPRGSYSSSAVAYHRAEPFQPSTGTCIGRVLSSGCLHGKGSTSAGAEATPYHVVTRNTSKESKYASRCVPRSEFVCVAVVCSHCHSIPPSDHLRWHRAQQQANMRKG